MAKPKENAALAYFERACRYSVFALEAHPQTHDKVPLMATDLGRVEALIAERKTADLEVLRTRVLIGFRDVRLDVVIKRVGAAARLVDMEHRSLKLVELLFGTKTPSEVARPSGAGIGREIDDAKDIVKAFALVPSPEGDPVRQLLPELTQAIAEAEVALAAHKAALERKQFVSRKVRPLKREVRVTFDRLEGQLQDQFPGQRELVASFFLPADVAGADEEDAEEAGEEGEGGEGSGGQAGSV